MYHEVVKGPIARERKMASAVCHDTCHDFSERFTVCFCAESLLILVDLCRFLLQEEGCQLSRDVASLTFWPGLAVSWSM